MSFKSIVKAAQSVTFDLLTFELMFFIFQEQSKKT